MGDPEEKNKALALRWIGPAPDGCGPMNVAPEGLDLLAEDAVWVMPPSSDIPGRQVRGRRAIAKIRELAATIYDISTIQNQVQNILAEGDFVTVRFKMSCKQLDGEDYWNEYVHILECRAGKIRHIWDYYDSLHWHRQVGSRSNI
jgi:ketosteroid isomerase-like protein